MLLHPRNSSAQLRVFCTSILVQNEWLLLPGGYSIDSTRNVDLFMEQGLLKIPLVCDAYNFFLFFTTMIFPPILILFYPSYYYNKRCGNFMEIEVVSTCCMV